MIDGDNAYESFAVPYFSKILDKEKKNAFQKMERLKENSPGHLIY